MLRSIEFENFRVLRKARLELQPFTLLVGPNGSGKSTVCFALELLQFLSCDSFERPRLLKERYPGGQSPPDIHHRRVGQEASMRPRSSSQQYAPIGAETAIPSRRLRKAPAVWPRSMGQRLTNSAK